MTEDTTSRRLEDVDALRGLALFGIAFGNVMWFSGTAVLSPAQRAALDTTTVDTIARQLVHVLVDGKFYSLFAMLFGTGFGLALSRAGNLDAACASFRRRMVVLAGIGALHAFLLWFGDIISLYAVTGLLLPLFARCEDRTLLRWSVLLLAMPIPLSFGLWIAHAMTDAGGTVADPGHGPAALLVGFAADDYATMLASNVAFLRERWVLALYSGRFCKLLGLFLFGYWCVRRGVVHRSQDHRGALARGLRLGLVIGIPLNIALAWFLTHVPERPPTLLSCARSVVYTLAAPSLALAYASGAALLFRWPRVGRLRRALAIVGRMTMTHYLLQSVLGIALFYGVGLGLWGSFGEAIVVAWLPIVFAAQVAISHLWLSGFRSGPVESLTRALQGRGSSGGATCAESA